MNYIFLTLSVYLFFLWLQNKTKLIILNPVLLSIISIILFLKMTNISYDEYYTGGKFISIFLGPATVALAFPLYKNWIILKERGLSILVAVFVGTITAIFSVLILSRVFNINESLLRSLLPKSITTPIGIEVSRKIGGIPSLTVAFIILTGVIGNMIGVTLFKILRIKDPVAIGAAFGTASHAIGTSKAIELGEIEGAISGVSIGIAGLITSLIIPLFILLL